VERDGKRAATLAVVQTRDTKDLPEEHRPWHDRHPQLVDNYPTSKRLKQDATQGPARC
jgi:hypothetical protein